jgi:hypothetical protein
MRRCQDDVEGVRFLVAEIELASGIDIGLNPLQQPEVVAVRLLISLIADRCRAASAIDIPPAILSPYE